MMYNTGAFSVAVAISNHDIHPHSLQILFAKAQNITTIPNWTTVFLVHESKKPKHCFSIRAG
jgi:hypothetical protein